MIINNNNFNKCMNILLPISLSIKGLSSLGATTRNFYNLSNASKYRSFCY